MKKTNDGRTLLMESAYHGNIEMTEFVLTVTKEKRPELIGQCDDEGWNAAMYALATSDSNYALRILEMLVKEAKLIPKTTNTGLTALMQSAQRGSVLISNFLLDRVDQFHIDLQAVDQDGCNCLHYAAMGGSVTVFKQLLSRGLRCCNDDKGRNVLMLAVSNANFEIINHILKKKQDFNIDINAKDTNGRNCLFYGVNSIDVMDRLISEGVTIQPDSDGASLAMYALEYGLMESAQWLFDNKHCDINDKDLQGNTCLFYALTSGNWEFIEPLLFNPSMTVKTKEIPFDGALLLSKVVMKIIRDEEKENFKTVDEILSKFSMPSLILNFPDEMGRTPFYQMVAEHLQKALRKYICYYDADLQFDNSNGITLLMHACSSGMLSIVELLLKEAKSRHHLLQLNDKQGRTALTYATVSQNLPIVRLMLEMGAAMTVDVNGQSALTYAIQAKNMQIALLLVSSCLSIDKDVTKARDREGNQLLHFCAYYGTSEQVLEKILLRLKPDLNARTVTESKTALMVAVANGNVSIVKVLLRHRCSITACDSHGRNVLHILAIASKQSDQRHFLYPALTLAQMILRMPNAASLIVNELDRDGKTPLALAVEAKSAELVFLLFEHGSRVNEMNLDPSKTSPVIRQLVDVILNKPSLAIREITAEHSDDLIEALELEENDDIIDKIRAVQMATPNLNHIYNDIDFNKLCQLLLQRGFNDFVSFLRSEFYKQTFHREFYV